MSNELEDTPTPRTDLEVEHAIQYCAECDVLSNCSLSVGQAVGKGFAKRLERELTAAQARIAELEAELESHAWEISPAMAQAKIDELNAKIERLEAQQPPAPKYLERPDAPGWWWCLYAGKPRIGEARMEWRQDESGKQLVWWSGLGYDADKINVCNLMGSKWSRATPPQTPSEEGAK